MNPILESARNEFRQRLDQAFADHLTQKAAGLLPQSWAPNLRLGMGTQTYAQQAGYNKSRQQEAPKPAAAAKPAGGSTWGGTEVGAGIAATKPQSTPASAPADPNKDKSVTNEF